jgi:hypothetical protein
MSSRTPPVRGLALIGLLVAALAPSASARASTVPAALRHSRNLWATIDVCNPADQHDAVGIRGSMPGDGNRDDRLYMRFRLQRLDSSSHQWIDISGASSPYVYAGSAKSARQAGRSFVLVPPDHEAFVLRGVVSYQWRHGGAVTAALSRATSAGHESLAGADPPGYSAAECRIA